jgi:ferredoxin
VMTGALKNTFGVIPGNRKAEFHVKCPDVETFSRMIVDLNGLIRPRMIVMDAIRAMEGNGPGAGDLVDIGLLIFSDDPVAVDAVCCRIMDIDPLSVPMIRIAQERGLGTASLKDMRIVGPGLDGYVRHGFKIPARSPTDRVPGPLFRVAKGLIAPKPVIDPRLCIGCGECVQACPTAPKSLSQAAGLKTVPRYDYKTCIRCYCCQETCRQDAIRVKPAVFSRFFTDPA